jgi:hypothetical protein
VHMRFTRTSEYEDLKGGMINYGQGLSFNVATDLPESGVVETDDARLQQVLSEYRGAHGRVFRAEIVTADGKVQPAELEPIPEPAHPRTPAEAIEERTTQRGPEDGYALLAEPELIDILRGKGVEFPANATKDELVQLIEADDKSKGV